MQTKAGVDPHFSRYTNVFSTILITGFAIVFGSVALASRSMPTFALIPAGIFAVATGMMLFKRARVLRSFWKVDGARLNFWAPHTGAVEVMRSDIARGVAVGRDKENEVESLTIELHDGAKYTLAGLARLSDLADWTDAPISSQRSGLTYRGRVQYVLVIAAVGFALAPRFVEGLRPYAWAATSLIQLILTFLLANQARQSTGRQRVTYLVVAAACAIALCLSLTARFV